MEFKKFLEAMKWIHTAWNDVPESTLRGAWNKLLLNRNLARNILLCNPRFSLVSNKEISEEESKRNHLILVLG